MTLRIGFFSDFKGANSVLLTGDAIDIESLVSALGEFVRSSEEQLAIHDLAVTEQKHPVQLYVRRAAAHQKVGVSSKFSWICNPDLVIDIQAQLRVLIRSSNGHQYFHLEGAGAQLIVSVGEYSDDWWKQ